MGSVLWDRSLNCGKRMGYKLQVIEEREKVTVITKETENNYVSIKGTLVSDFKFSHSIYGEKFYLVYLRAER